jgi:DNA modification methylase
VPSTGKRIKIEYVPLKKLKTWDSNPRVISDFEREALRKNISKFGVVDPIIIDERNVVIGGNQRVDTLRALGWKQVPVVRLRIKLKDIPILNLALNRIHGEWDFDKLAPILEKLHDLPELELTGFSLKEADIVISQEELIIDPADELTPELPKKPKTRLGDLYLLGNHRLLCGDCTKPDSWKTLMAGGKAALEITDPPYGVAYDVRRKFSGGAVGGQFVKRFNKRNWGRLKGDEVSSDLTQKALTAFLPHTIKEWSAYITCGLNLMVDLIIWLRANKIHYSVPALVWDKEIKVLVWSHYHAAHENIIWCGPGSRPGGLARWFGPKNEGSVWHIPVDAFGAKRVHPTQKPVALYERALLNSSAKHDIVCDSFAGSGTLIIAAEKHRRKAYCMELDPRFCDVIVTRWEQYTGKKAERTSL